MKVSFCTACKGRLFQLRQTLPLNLADNADCPNVEFVLLDYSSDDGLSEWVSENLRPEIERGRLIFYASRGQPWFHMAHAKNCAHRPASGDVLVNLDADNFTGAGFARYLIEEFHNGFQMAIPCSPNGSNGRIALTRELFHRAGGYDENFDGYGWDDNDLKERVLRMGIKAVVFPTQYQRCLDDDGDRTCHYPHACHDKEATNSRNKKLSEQNVLAEKLVANQGRRWGSIIVRKNFGEFVEL